MMANFTNINKMNNNRSSYLTLLNTKETTTYDVGNPDPDLELAHKCGRVNQLLGSMRSMK